MHSLRTTLAFALAASVAVPAVVCGLAPGQTVHQALAAAPPRKPVTPKRTGSKNTPSSAAPTSRASATRASTTAATLGATRLRTHDAPRTARGASSPAPAAAAVARGTKSAPAKVKPPCLRDAVGVMRGAEEARFALTRCDGSPAPLAVEHLSVLARPNAASLAPANVAFLAKRAGTGTDLARGVRRVDARLVDRLQTVVDHFAHGAARPPRIVLVSGYRPTSTGSYHAHGKALDFRLDGVNNEELVAFCKTLPDTGCGYYPNSSFVHLDVRDAGTGHVTWIDGSGPGESPHYVSAWPPSPSESPAKADATRLDPIRQLDSEASAMPIDEHPSTPQTEPPGATEDEAEEASPLPSLESSATSDGDQDSRP